MKQLLMLLDHFPPAFAPRMGYLAKYLKDMGWDAVALHCPHPEINTGFEHLAKYIENYNIDIKHLFKNHTINRFLSEFYGLTKFRHLWSLDDEAMYKKTQEILKCRHFDAIICSTASFFPLNCASRIAKETKLPMLIDLRDIYEQNTNLLSTNTLSRLLHKRQIVRRNKILANAAAVTTVSSWHKNFLSQFNNNTSLVFNGFDENIFVFPKAIETKKFTITYTGSITLNGEDSQRSPELLFQAVSEQQNKQNVSTENICIRFFTNEQSFPLIKHLAKKYNVENVETHGRVAAVEVPQLLYNSNILLLLASEKNTRGVLTTKLFEYMASNREILCIPNSGGEIEHLLTQSQAGCCINTLPELCAYLKFKYNEWQKKHYVEPHTDRLFAENFSRERQAMQFVNILNNIIKTNNL